MRRRLGSMMVVMVALSLAVLAGCKPMSAPLPPTTQTQPNGMASSLSAGDLRDLLADFADAHHDKIQLAWWVSTPFRPVDAPFKPFFENMGTQNKALLAELEAWAKAHHVDLTYRYGSDIDGQAQKLMESRQEKLVRGDDRANFQRDILMQMYSDYEWRICQYRTALPAIEDPALKAYMQKALGMYESGDAEIVALLKHYKYQ